VNIPDLSMSSYTIANNQIEILLDPSLSSGPVVIPPAKVSTAAFLGHSGERYDRRRHHDHVDQLGAYGIYASSILRDDLERQRQR